MAEADKECWSIGDLIVDVGGQSVTRGGEAMALPQLSFRFLLALLRAAPNVLTIDELMEQVWTGIFVNAETVTQRAKLLRDALGDDPKAPRYFVVRRGVGYQMLAVPIRVGSDAVSAAEPRKALGRYVRLALGTAALGLVSINGPSAMTVWPEGSETATAATVRVVVLPFDNLSSDPADAFIARSIPEMVLNRLSSVQGLTVLARESSLLGASAVSPPRQAGVQLNAGYVIKGSVQRLGGMLRVTCFVIDTSRDARLWSERFDWPVDRLYALQDRIADRVAGSLESKVHGLGGLVPAPVPSRNTDAYLAYLKGKSLLGRFTVGETDAAGVQFERAVKLDPDFADALVSLFDARMQGADLRKDDLAPFRIRYQPLLDHALTVDPNSGAALFAKAMWSDLTQDERSDLFRRAAERDPSNSRGLTAYAQFLDKKAVLRDGAPAGEGQALLDRVLAIDPLSPQARWWAVQRRWTSATPDQVEQAMARELAIDPQNTVVAERYAFRRWMFHGETAEAIAKMERVTASDPQNPSAPHFAAAFYLDADDPGAASAIAATTPASRDAARVLLAEYVGDWRGAGAAALGRRGFLFNVYQNFNWSEAVRDYAVNTGSYRQGAEAIATRFGFDLRNPRIDNIAKSTAAPALGDILIRSGERAKGEQLLAQTVQWIDAHPSYGLGGVKRTRAEAMMLLGQRDQALSDLRSSFETGHDIRQWWYVIDRDPVWAPARTDPRFQAIAELCRQAARGQRAKLDGLRHAGAVPLRAPAIRG